MPDVIPGDGRWVFDHLAERRSNRLPVAGWRGSGTICSRCPSHPMRPGFRPRMPDDDRLIRVTALEHVAKT